MILAQSRRSTVQFRSPSLGHTSINPILVLLLSRVCCSPTNLGNVFVAFFARLPALETVQVVLVDEVLDVALYERRVHVEEMPELFLNL